MTAIEVQVVDTITPLLEKIRERALRVDGPDGPLPAIGEVMVASTKKTFEMEGRPNRWQPLALATLFGRAGVSFVGGKMAGNAGAFKKGFLTPLGEGEKNRTFRTIQKGATLSVDSLTAGARKRMEGAKILRRTTRLMNSIAYETTGGAVSWGTNLIYAALQHFGGRAGRNKKVTVPGRPYVMDPFPEDWKLIEGILFDFLALSEGGAA